MDLFNSLPDPKPLTQPKKSPSLIELLSGINLPASMGAAKEFVVENAPAGCKFGTDIAFIPASGGEVKIGSQLFLTKENKEFEAPYFGICLKQTADKKEEGKEEEVDCDPNCEPYEWTNIEEATTVGGEGTLTVRSKLSCSHAGAPETINILDSGQGTDGKKMMGKLLAYDIYAKIVYDMDGNPQIFWSLEQDGRGVFNPEMSRYLKKVAPYLNFNIVNFISNDDWIDKINEATRNGYDYTTGKDYNWFVKWTAQRAMNAYDVYNFLTESELGAALMTLGFAYADYRLAYNQPKSISGDKTKDAVTGSKDGKNFTLDRNNSTANGTYKKASGGNNFKIGPNARNHLENSEGFVRKKGKGVVGGHNMDSFYDELIQQGFNIDDCIINKKPHPTIEGIYEVEYRVPKEVKGQLVPNEYKNISRPKTVYDPNVFSTDEIYNLGIEAMQSGTVNGNIVEGFASNGLKFTGYIDSVTGEITNFFPTLR